MPRFMGFSLTSPAPEKGDPTAENRVWGFFGDAPQSHRENRPQSLQPRQGNRLSLTKTVSGRTYWPSRDPIGERGGINLYGMVGNDAVGQVDYLGRFAIEWGAVGGFFGEVGTGITAGAAATAAAAVAVTAIVVVEIVYIADVAYPEMMDALDAEAAAKARAEAAAAALAAAIAAEAARCLQVKDDCIKNCLCMFPTSFGVGVEFLKCVADCMIANGCDG